MHHTRGLRKLLKDEALVDAIVFDYAEAKLEPRRKAMLDFAAKLTRTPQKMARADYDRLREQGFSDLDILNIVEVTAYYAYVNRIADGLGVELEDHTQLE